MAKPTRGDAELILQLVGLLQSAEQADARRWFFKEFKAKDFAEFNKNYPKSSDERQKVSTVLGFFETAGVLVWHGLLNADLFFDLSFGLELVYQKVAPIIPGWQKQAKAPALWENVQWLAEGAETWNKTVWKPKVKAVTTSRPRR